MTTLADVTTFADVTASSPDFTVRLLGHPLVRDEGGEWRLLERKAAALLALEGAMKRGRLVTLLWPDTREAAARNNLVHLLRKLHQLANFVLVEGRELLSLAPSVRVDVHALQLGGAALPEDVVHATLLGTHSFDDCQDLEEWVACERERLEEWCLLALGERARTLEEAGAYDAALACVLRLLDLDPFSEDAYYRLMRLHALRGNRHRALRAFDRLCDLLRRELNAEPLRATVDLARTIRSADLSFVAPNLVSRGVQA
ncbi:AfsR/SARP family transcriptional regulator [Deinococcus yavapaiensis]|uniref:DNA-binding SARP family transcriptional activator n=1 Tax=Deinococcus yavapaiensis KR-236 TaxID=694435 RepID=A0A318S3Q1_9DEIO|nr:BTAD domain-containing putative transcriptional regulator [Deinococcus yavapaiensis]PYE51077.1 DNA-binding SARP family transcriptional activator [Deinococcus yavapaiensis KR-236]